MEARRYLVCARGNSNWVRNARAAGEVVLVRAMRRQHYAVREVPMGMRQLLLKAYLDRYAREVQRFFPVVKGSPIQAFEDLAPRYPVFELLASPNTPPCGRGPGGGAVPVQLPPLPPLPAPTKGGCQQRADCA